MKGGNHFQWRSRRTRNHRWCALDQTASSSNEQMVCTLTLSTLLAETRKLSKSWRFYAVQDVRLRYSSASYFILNLLTFKRSFNQQCVLLWWLWSEARAWAVKAWSNLHLHRKSSGECLDRSLVLCAINECNPTFCAHLPQEPSHQKLQQRQAVSTKGQLRLCT